jgi:ATP-dependent Lhr-like helicase
LDRLSIPENALDILAQQIVAIAAGREISVEDLWRLVRRAWPFRNLKRHDFDAVIEVLAEGVSTRRGRRSAHLHYDRVHGVLRPRRGARLAAITSGGAIPDTADYDVVEDPAGTFVGKVNEDFAVESMQGDVFLLGNRSWRIRRVESGKMRVIDAGGAPATIPFWLGEAPARTAELSAAVAELRHEVAGRCQDAEAAAAWLLAECGVDRGGAEQIVRYVADTLVILGAVPTLDTVIAERFFDEGGGMQLVLHAPFGGRVNRALGLLLRKRFCVGFDFELQAAATDDGIVLSLGEQHSFPLDSVFGMLRVHGFEADLLQAVLAAPMFTNRWRWNATRALTLLRHMGGRRVPMPIQRMRAEDLLAAVFPAQLACQDNNPGRPIEPPDHPLVNETIANCLHEAMDVDGLRGVLEGIARGTIRALSVETPAPSPMSHEILNANPYAFLDDAPLEERRARAVSLRRADPDLASGLGALDPQAIAEVRAQAWPDVRDADEAHDALHTLGLLPEAEGAAWREYLETLVATGRATRVWLSGTVPAAFVAAERIALVRAAFPDARFERDIEPPPLPHARETDEEEAIVTIVRGWIESIGPTSAAALAARLSLPLSRVNVALARLEGEGVVLRGRYTAGAEGEEWCDRALLTRIHRMTLGRLRREIEAVPAADFMRFLFRWQHVQPGQQLHGRDGVRAVIAQLEGIELPGPAWERDVLPARIAEYDPRDLEQLCLAGEIAWGRLAVAQPSEDDEIPAPASRRRQAPTRQAALAFALREDLPSLLAPLPADRSFLKKLSPAARDVFAHLETRGASFLADVARALRRLPGEVEEALWELVASGLVTGDGIAGLRTLLLPEEKRAPRKAHLRALPGRGPRRSQPIGRWSLLRAEPHSTLPAAEAVEAAARRLLARTGVVFRELSLRERRAPSWRSLLQVLRRLEARGEIRGGRFVAGFVGEQFALPEAVEALRAVRRNKEEELVVVAAADPLNLVGLIVDLVGPRSAGDLRPPGARVSPFSGQVIAFRNGVPVEIGDLGAVRSRLQPGGAT